MAKQSEQTFPGRGYYEWKFDPPRPDRYVYFISGEKSGNRWFDTRRENDHKWVPLDWMCVPTVEEIGARHTERLTGVVSWYEMTSTVPEGVPPHG